MLYLHDIGYDRPRGKHGSASEVAPSCTPRLRGQDPRFALPCLLLLDAVHVMRRQRLDRIATGTLPVLGHAPAVLMLLTFQQCPRRQGTATAELGQPHARRRLVALLRLRSNRPDRRLLMVRLRGRIRQMTMLAWAALRLSQRPGCSFRRARCSRRNDGSG